MGSTIDAKLCQQDKDFIKNLVSKTEGLTSPDEIYDAVSLDYDRSIALLGVTVLAEKLVKFLCQFIGSTDLSGISAIDIACGTGIVGLELAKKGCKQIHGLDFSKGMIDVCSKKNIYSKLFNVPLKTEPTPNIADNTYDVAMASSCYEIYGVPLDTIREVIRIIKPGGYFVFTLMYVDYSVDYMGFIGELIKENMVELHCMKQDTFCRNPLKDWDEWCTGYLVALKKL